ncbi:unnamed protein product [Alopecurus aequalis]
MASYLIRGRSEADGVDVLHVWVEEPPVLLHAVVLLVLVEHGEDVGLDAARVTRGAAPDVVDQVLVVDPGVGRRRRLAAARWPPALRDHELHAAAAVLGHRRVEGVHRRVEQVLVTVGAVLDHGAGRREERVAHVKGARVVGPRQVRVDVGHQRRAGAGKELHDGSHERVRLPGERAGGGRAVHAEDGLRHRRGHLDVSQPGGGERALHVLHGGEEVLRGAARDLVADADVTEGDLRVRLDVVPHPRGGGGRAGGERGEDVVGRPDDHVNARAADGLQRRLVGSVQPHGVDSVGLEHAHDFARRRQVVGAHAVANPDGLDACVMTYR